jgi:hypothetical protein
VSVSPPARRDSPAEAIGGLLAAASIAASAISIAWHPLRLVIAAALLACVATAIGGRHERLAFYAIVAAAVAFFAGMTLAVITSNPVW